MASGRLRHKRHVALEEEGPLWGLDCVQKGQRKSEELVFFLLLLLLLKCTSSSADSSIDRQCVGYGRGRGRGRAVKSIQSQLVVRRETNNP